MISLSWLVPLLPLLGFIVVGVLNKRISVNLSGAIASAAVFLSFLISCALFYAVSQGPELFSPEGVVVTQFDWITAGDLTI